MRGLRAVRYDVEKRERSEVVLIVMILPASCVGLKKKGCSVVIGVCCESPKRELVAAEMVMTVLYGGLSLVENKRPLHNLTIGPGGVDSSNPLQIVA